MKKPAARKTIEQLKTAVWPDRASALADLKPAGLAARGADYELREYKPGSWQLLPLTDDAPREERVVQALRKQPGKPARGAPTVLVHAKAPVKAPAKPTPPQPPAKAADKAPDGEAPANALKPTIAPPEGPEAVTLKDLLMPLPSGNRPYEIVIAEGSCAIFPAHAAHTAAMRVSQLLRVPVLVRSEGMEINRVYDWAAIQRDRKAAKQGRRGPGGRKASGDSKFARAARLLFREQGATAAELERECDWERVGQRHVNRASKFNDNAKITILGDKHWRLEKPKTA